MKASMVLQLPKTASKTDDLRAICGDDVDVQLQENGNVALICQGTLARSEVDSVNLIIQAAFKVIELEIDGSSGGVAPDIEKQLLEKMASGAHEDLENREKEVFAKMAGGALEEREKDVFAKMAEGAHQEVNN